jgi:hypothetical protein
MSIRPAKYNISLRRRADYRLGIELQNPDGSPISLVGANVYCEIWNEGRTTKYAEFTIEYVNRSNGEINIVLYSHEIDEVPCEAFYDLMIEDSTGFKQYYMEGMVYVSEGYSEPS